MKNLLGIITSVFLLGSTIACSTISSVEVAFVIDGDTFADNRDNRYRLFGVDTPEYQWLEEDEEPDSPLMQIYAETANEETRRLIEHKTIDVHKEELDVYERVISKWVINNYDVGIHLVHYGFARVEYISTTPGDAYYTTDHQYYEALLVAQKHAFDNALGIWEDPENYSEIFA